MNPTRPRRPAPKSRWPEAGDVIAARRSEAAARANAEAAARRAEADEHAKAAERQIEISGRGGPDPVRYGDWEVKGIATDF